MKNTGYFLFSLDTELATGYFDLERDRGGKFSNDGLRERRSISKLIDILEEYNITGTWALVGHLFYERCKDCEECRMIDWKGKYSSFEEVHSTCNPLWYGSDIVEMLLKKGTRQEIAFHGFTHKIFNEDQMSSEEAEKEALKWLSVAQSKGIVPRAVVYPRNVVGHTDILSKAGFICFRMDPDRSWLIRNKLFGRYAKALDQILGVSSLPIFDLEVNNCDGMVSLYSSQCFFDLNRKAENILDRLNLHDLRFRRVIRGIHKAAEEKKMLHIWAHPSDFRTEKDFLKLRHILDALSHEVQLGRMRSVGMTEMARIMLEQNSSTGL